jgi:hypothetical protein
MRTNKKPKVSWRRLHQRIARAEKARPNWRKDLPKLGEMALTQTVNVKELAGVYGLTPWTMQRVLDMAKRRRLNQLQARAR